MAEVGDIRGRVAERVRLGLTGAWYAAAKSVQVQPGRPLAMRVLGRDLVVWRDGGGRLKCVDDLCPHRGAPLSRGEVIDGNLACRYHGVVVDGNGVVVRVPAMPDCPIEGRKPVASHPVAEAADAVFVYLGAETSSEPAPLDLPPEFGDPEWTGFLCVARWSCNYGYALDNIADPMHGSFLHADSFTLAYGGRRDLMEVEETPSGFFISRVGQRGRNLDRTQFVTESGGIHARLDIPYPPAAGPGGPFRIIGYVTPVDATTCLVFFWRLRRVSGLAREAWRFLYRTTLELHHWRVLEQDREILEALADDARDHELLYQHDIGVIRLRRILAQRARVEIEAEDSRTRAPAAASA